MNLYIRRAFQIGLLVAMLLITSPSLYAQTDPEAVDDEALLQTANSAVVIPVLDNDLPDSSAWNPSTVRIIDPTDFVTQLTKYVEPDQGIWEVNTTGGSISFTPCTGNGTPDPECTSALSIKDPFAIDYVVQDTNGTLSNPAIVTVTYADPPLSASLGYFFSSLTGDMTTFVWVMEIESNTKGFNLFSEVDGELTLINNQLIVATGGNTFIPQRYEYATQVEGEQFYLYEISLSDSTASINGPFDLGVSYGEDPLNEGGEDYRIFLPFINAPAQ
ncbi:MAG: hypothetical protein KDD92_18815 [Caldilineaceae bacterium]|nr:hypothetical protein [Caldilineaceae bacterium]